MKQYPKFYEDICTPLTTTGKRKTIIDSIEPVSGSINTLTGHYKSFFRESDIVLFNMIVRYLWLENQIVINGVRKTCSADIGVTHNWAYGYFIRAVVGADYRHFTQALFFKVVALYIKELFPDFLKHNPFTEPGYYTYPFKNISIAHMAFVYYMFDERVEILRMADERAMSYCDFTNWVVNYIFCYNDEIGEDRYRLSRHHRSVKTHSCIRDSHVDNARARQELIFQKSV